MAILKYLFPMALVFVMAVPAARSVAGGEPAAAPGRFMALCYHSIQPQRDPKDPYRISQQQFIEQLEYLRSHNFSFISLADLAAAREGRRPLPEKAVMLTFDDAYRSFYDFVFPVLERFDCPALLSVVGRWIEEDPPEGLSEPLLNWAQIAELAQHPLVTIASHSYDLHRAVQYTPQGNVGPVVGVRAYQPARQRYETEEAYRHKLGQDFQQQKDLFIRRISKAPQAIVWPYGHYNAIGEEIARQNGLIWGFALDEKQDGAAHLATPERLNRYMVSNGTITDFIRAVNRPPLIDALRAVQVDLDLVYDPESTDRTDQNLGRLIDRLAALKVNTVFLQAFADPNGDGNIRRVYFQNRELPVRADIFAHAVHQMRIRGFKVYAWMPALSVIFEDEAFNARFRVQEHRNGRLGPSSGWYERLSPFASEVAVRMVRLFEDLAAGALISGVLFQDDAYLSDTEDFHPAALARFEAITGRPVEVAELLGGGEVADRWMGFKTEYLLEYIDGLMAAVRTWRPDARFGRNLYARVLTEPQAQRWFAQDYQGFLQRYDYVVVMAYPHLEKAGRPLGWLKRLARLALTDPAASDKMVFKLQTYDWQRKQWVDDDLLLRQMRTVLAEGIRHLAYYPDNFWEAKPDISVIQLEMSTRREWDPRPAP
jgi:poly-beta-1,6-N-acetyl-D-glucosamine N-deacetylase